MKIFLIISIILVGVPLIVRLHLILIKGYYPYRWLAQSVAYPFLYWWINRSCKRLGVVELDKSIDKILKQRDSWFVRKLLNLVMSYRLKIDDNV